MEKDEGVPVSPANSKKLKQTRLPFQILSPPGGTPKVIAETKKRKLSVEVTETPEVPETKENREGESDVDVSEVIDLDEIESDKDDVDKDVIKFKMNFGKKKVKLDEMAEKKRKTKKVKRTKAKVPAVAVETAHESENDVEIIEEQATVEAEIPIKRAASPLVEPETTKKLKVSDSPAKLDADELEDKSQESKISLSCREDLPSTSSSPSKMESLVEPSSPVSHSAPETTSTSPKAASMQKEKQPTRTPRSHKKLTEAEKAEREKLREQQKQEKLQKQEEEKQQKAREREEKRAKEKAEREAVKQKEREAKEQQKQKEKEEKEEKLRKEREEKEAQKREKERKRQEEIDAKNEEKRKKEEETKKREEEKLKTSKKSVEMFQKFFVKKLPSTDEKKIEDETSNHSTEISTNTFMPFQIKEGMRLAPPFRNTLTDEQKADLTKMLETSAAAKENLYIEQLKNPEYVVKKSDSTWPQDDDDDGDDIKLIDNLGEEHDLKTSGPKIKRRYRVKFLKFCENRRPAYYGTWRKRSLNVSGRKPFVEDKKFFDYEVDSDLEWEDEGEGESLHGSDDEKEKEEDDDYEVDNDFFVPHGHLSDEEMQDDEKNYSPEAAKMRLQLMQIEFEAEMKKKTEKLKPRLIGVVWMHNDAVEPDNCSPYVWGILKTREMLFTATAPIDINWDDPVEESVATATPAQKRTKITNDDMPDLIRLVHGNTHSRKFLVDEFMAYRKAKYGDREDFMELMHVGSKIKEIAEYRAFTEEGMEKLCGWFVKPEVLEKFELRDLPIPNTWEYSLEPKKKLISNEKPKSNTSVRFTDTDIKDLIRLVHGNPQSRKFLVEEFAAFRKATYGNTEDFTELRFVGSKIKNIAEWKQQSTENGKPGWCVMPEILEKYQLNDLPAENTWKYTLDVPKRKSLAPKVEKKPEEEQDTRKTGVNIQKFAKVLTETEKKQQFATPKKRVPLLMSVPCGEEIPETKKNTLISQFLQKAAETKSKQEPVKVDEVITID